MRSEEGSIGSVFLIGCWTLALFLLVIAADFGRAFMYREQLRTAADAAALAGAMQVNKMVKVTLYRQSRTYGNANCDAGAPVTSKCHSAWGEPTPIPISGTERVVWDNWERTRPTLCNGNPNADGAPLVQCVQEVWECWIEPKSDWADIRKTAEKVFQDNAGRTQWNDLLVTPVQVEYPRGDQGRKVLWREFEVKVNALIRVPAIFWRDEAGRPGAITVTLKEAATAVQVRGDQAGYTPPPCPGAVK